MCGKKKGKVTKGFGRENHPKFKPLVERTHFYEHRELIFHSCFHSFGFLEIL